MSARDFTQEMSQLLADLTRVVDLERRLAAVEATCARLRTALARYGCHEADCPRRASATLPCGCGLDPTP